VCDTPPSPYSLTHKTVTGWGDGFLNTTLKAPAFGINFGVSGASMPSYRESGQWAEILSLVGTYNATNEVIVTIQFGHNDQKVPAYEEAFSENLKQFVLDVKNAGGVPVCIEKD
jgi:lysophospholipase L1-like esterase